MRQQAFFKTDEAKQAIAELKLMMNDPMYNTRSTYSAGSDANISFADHHIIYLSEHPNLNPSDYLSNLRLKTKLRR